MARPGLRASLLATLWLGTLAGPASLAVAGNRHYGDEQQRDSRDGGISLDEAVRRAERQFHARVVKAETQSVDGRAMYVLRLVSDDGRVFTVRVDAATGSIQ